jgi:phosphatidylinositol alpha-1,6-mannosyltransferase
VISESVNKQQQVLFLTRKWPPAVGGMETYSLELSEELAKLPEISLEVRRLAGRKDGRPPSALSIVGFFVKTAWHLMMNRGHYDVVHYGDMVQIGLAWLNRLISPRTRNVIALHGLDVIYGRRNGLMPRIYKAYTQFANRRGCIDCYIANSRFTAKLLGEEGFAPITVVPLGVRLDTDQIRPAIDAIGDERFVLFFGRIFRRKGPRWFAEHVIPLLPDDVLLYVIGTIWQQSDGEYLESNSRVRMLGAFPVDISRDQFESLKRSAIAVIMPNRINKDGMDVEGFGLTALEAADHGAPLIAADVEGIKDAVIHGKTGFLEPAEDANAWARRIIQLLDWSVDERRAFSKQAQLSLLQNYSWHRVAIDTLKVYKT